MGCSPGFHEPKHVPLILEAADCPKAAGGVSSEQYFQAAGSGSIEGPKSGSPCWADGRAEQPFDQRTIEEIGDIRRANVSGQ
jgi:hypothetical protein